MSLGLSRNWRLWAPRKGHLAVSAARKIETAGGQQCADMMTPFIGTADIVGHEATVARNAQDALFPDQGSNKSAFAAALYLMGVIDAGGQPMMGGMGRVWWPEGMASDTHTRLKAPSELPPWLHLYPGSWGDQPVTTAIRLAADGSGGLSLRNWLAGHADGIGPGCTMLYFSLWSPRLRVVASTTTLQMLFPNSPPYLTKIVRDASDVWFADQWPYGNALVRVGTSDPAFPDVSASTPEEYLRARARPLWILTNRPHEMFGLDPENLDGLVIAGAGSSFPGGPTDWAPIQLRGGAVFWIDPETRTHLPHYFYRNWLDRDPIAVDPSAKQFLGTPCFLNAAAQFKRTISNIEPPFNLVFRRVDMDLRHFIRSNFASGVPPEWNPDYPNEDRETFFIARRADSGGLGHFTGGADVAGLTASGGNVIHAPHLWIDAQMSVEGIEFARHPMIDEWRDAGGVVEFATAEIYIENPERVALDWHWLRTPKGSSAPGSPVLANGEAWSEPGLEWTDPEGQPQGRFGWIVYQHSQDGPVGDANEAPVIVQKVVNDGHPSGDSLPEGDNTHVSVIQWERDVSVETGVTPTRLTVIDEADPQGYQFTLGVVPRAAPWYPEESAGIPPTITPLLGARICIAAISMQPWGQYVGQSDALATPRSLKEMERVALFHPDGVEFPSASPDETMTGWEPTQGFGLGSGSPPPRIQELNDPARSLGIVNYPPGNYRSWLLAREEVPAYVDDLECWFYRWVGRVAPRVGTGLVEVVPGNEWRTANLLELFEAIFDDVPRMWTRPQDDTEIGIAPTRYRLLPCGTGSVQSAPHLQWNGEWMNAAPLLESLWPKTISWPEDIWDETLHGGTGGYRAPDVRSENHVVKLEGITYQNWDSFRIRRVRVGVRMPDGTLNIWAITTPYDSE